jgi:hypothetical protein
MTGSTAHWIDTVARRLAGAHRSAGGRSPERSLEGSFDRRSLLRTSALGILALSLREVPSAAAARFEAAGACTGGSLKACYATVDRNFDKYVRTLCDTLKDKKGDPFGTASYSCYVGWLSSRLDVRKDCRANCPKPKKKKAPAGGQPGGGGGTTAPGGGGHIPTCGDVDCVQGDLCCKSDAGPICCAVCCSKAGGCGSSESDCS